MEQLNKINQKLVSSISRDLQHPILELEKKLVEMFEELPATPKSINHKAHVEHELTEVKTAISQLEEWSRNEMVKSTLQPEKLIFRNIINPILGMYDDLIVANKLEIKTEDLNQSITVDKLVFKYIVRNVIYHAVENTPKQGIVTITASENQHTKTLHLVHSGECLNDQERQRILNPDLWFDNDVTLEDSDTHIGLTTAIYYVSLLNGTFDIECKDDTTTVEITLPSNT